MTGLRGTAGAGFAAAVIAAVLAGSAPAPAAAGAANGLIAFARDRNGGAADIFVMNPDGSGQVDLTQSADVDERDPAWSPDGRMIAFARGDNGGAHTLYVMNADGTGTRAITDTPTGPLSSVADPAWSPDGGWLAFTANGLLFKVRLDGSALTQLTAPQPPQGSSQPVDRSPSWSPDGQTIAFDRYVWGGAPALIQVCDPPAAPGEPPHCRLVPDLAPGTPTAPTDTVLLIGADGTAEHALTSGGNPSWTPDGIRLAFTDAGAIYTIAPDGSDRRQLAPDTTGARTVTWSPDQTELVYDSIRQPPGLYASQIFRIAADGSGDVQLTTTPPNPDGFVYSSYGPTWQPLPPPAQEPLPPRDGTDSADVGVVTTATPDTIAVGETVTIVSLVTNHGPGFARDVKLTVALTPGLELVSATSTQGACNGAPSLVCAIGSLASSTTGSANPDGDAATVTVVARATAPGVYDLTPTVEAAPPDPNVGDNNHPTFTVTVTAPPTPSPPPDTVAPTVHAFAASGSHSRLVRLRFSVWDDSGRAIVTIRVTRRGVLVASTRWSIRSSRNLRSISRRLAAGRYVFSVRAKDAAGNTSRPSFAPVRVR